MTRGTVLVVLAAVAVVALAVVFGRAPERPSGPAGSSYATTPGGVAAYATLLERAGHHVRRLRAPLDEQRPSPAETVVVVDGDPLGRQQAAALRAQVRAGGRAILAGDAATALGDDAALPRRAGGTAPVTRRLGRGTLILAADAEPFRNRALADDDHAAATLALAGAPGRPVAFVESVHGYADQRGLAALPDGVQTCLILLALAALAFLVLRGRRLGPPERRARELPPPRRAHVEALAAALARTKDKDTILTATATTTEDEAT
jgi:hypothetical protein